MRRFLLVAAFFFVGMLLSGCAPSPYLIPGDAKLESALANLPRPETQTLDETLFLEAQAFEAYRPDVGPILPTPQMALQGCLFIIPGMGPFSGFVGGDLGSYEIRRRAYVAAAQFYEELLRRSPESPLAARSLFRLGWCYRNALIGSYLFGGSFRRGSREVFAELSMRYPDSPEGKLVSDARHVPVVNPFWMKVFSGVIPGAGQWYCGETKNGWIRFGAINASALVLGVGAVGLAHGANPFLSGALALLGFVAVDVTWTSSMYDAERAAFDYNERIEEEFHRRHPLPPPPIGVR